MKHQSAVYLYLVMVVLTLIGIQVDSSLRISPSKKGQCPKPKLRNGWSKLRLRGRMVKFVCRPGYILEGFSMAICKNEMWSHNVPLCIGPGCQDPVIPPGVQMDKSKDNAKMNFKCPEGSVMKGPKTIYCDRKNWSDRPPTCITTTTTTTTTITTTTLTTTTTTTTIPTTTTTTTPLTTSEPQASTSGSTTSKLQKATSVSLTTMQEDATTTGVQPDNMTTKEDMTISPSSSSSYLTTKDSLQLITDQDYPSNQTFLDNPLAAAEVSARFQPKSLAIVVAVLAIALLLGSLIVYAGCKIMKGRNQNNNLVEDRLPIAMTSAFGGSEY